jgi:F-type H+-transporting ATPase subunit c
MKSLGSKWWLMALLILLVSPTALAQDDAAGGQGDGLSLAFALTVGFGCLGAAICTIGGGYAIARIGGKCIESIGRQPEAAGSMFAPMVIAAAMVEGATLFAILVCLYGVSRV